MDSIEKFSGLAPTKKQVPPDASVTPQPKIQGGESLPAFAARLDAWRKTNRGAVQRQALSGSVQDAPMATPPVKT
jgi:hypothetical protein